MKENRRRARAIAIAATQQENRQQWLRLGFLTGFVILGVGIAFRLMA